MSAFAIKLDLQGLRDSLGGMAAECEEAARPAAQAGAQVLYDDVKRRVAGIKRHTGNLDRSIYQAYSKDNSGKGLAVYHVSWNVKKAPHGHLVEWGHLQRYQVSFDPATRRFITHKDRLLPVPVQVGAKPFMRPAIAKFAMAQQVMADRYVAELRTRGVAT